ncbi:EI24 domain-containing protein, partial [Acinetobacter baumannii]
RGGSLLQSLGASLAATALALVLIVLSMPLWLIPPLVMVLPPLIWGWLTYQVFGFDVLAEHASAEERRALLKEHRLPMLVMGV